MRVFCFGTGRSGTVTLTVALAHATNYEVLHETFCAHACYPDQWIEVNPQLRLVTDRVLRRHPGALFVWMTRDRQRVIDSYERLNQGRWLGQWWSFNNTVRPPFRAQQAAVAVDDMLAQCERAYNLIPPGQRRKVAVEDAPAWFPRLWADIHAEGDMAAALAEFGNPRNTSRERGDA